MPTRPFVNNNTTKVLTLTTTTSTPVLLSNPESTKGSLRLFNNSSVLLYIALAPTSALATAWANVPSSVTPSRSIGIPAGAVEILSFPFETTYIAGIAASGTGDLQVTEGRDN